MQNLAIGTDIIELDRVEEVYAKHGLKFAEKILSADELAEFKTSCKTPSRFLAKRFAVKEACVKALGTGFKQGIIFKNIKLFHDDQGKPCVKFFGEFAKVAELKQLEKWEVSISDTKNLILAFVVAC